MSRTASWAIGAILLASSLPALAAEISLSFSDAPGGGASGFRIERRAAGAKRFEALALVGPGVAGFVDRGLPAGATYCYRVRAMASEGASAWSPEVCAPAEEPAPAEVAAPPDPNESEGAKPAAGTAPAAATPPPGSEPRRIRTSGGWLQVLD